MINKIKINNITRKAYPDRKVLGISGENGFETLQFNLDTFIDGQGILEIEKLDKEGNTKTYFIELDKNENCYLLKVKSSLLDVAGDVRMQLVIKQENEEIFKSNIFTLKVIESINATETIPEQYQTWIDTIDAKLEEVDDKLAEVIELEEQLSRVVEDLEQKRDNGYFKGEKGEKGDKGDPGVNGQDGIDGADGYTPIKGVDYYTEEEKEQIRQEIKAELDKQIEELEQKKDMLVNQMPYSTVQGESINVQDANMWNENKLAVMGNLKETLADSTQEKSTTNPATINTATGVQRIKKYRKNKLKLPDAETEFAGVTIKIQDNKLILNGPASSGGFKVITSEIKTLLKGTYTFSQVILSGTFNTGAYRLCLKNESVTDAVKSPLTFTSGVGFATNTVDTNITELGIYINKGNVYNNYTIGLQVEEGNLTDYEPYTEENYELDLGETELCKLAEDSIDKAIYKDNKWQWEKVIKKIVLNGTEYWNIDTKQSGCNYYSFFIKSSAIPKPVEYSKIVTNLLKEDVEIYETDNIGICVNWAGAIRLKNRISTTVEELKAWLSENNITAYYVLKTPEYEDCTEEQSAVLDKLYNNLELSKGVNYIEVDINNVADEKEDLLKGITWTQGQISTTDGKTIVSSSTRYHTPLIEIEKEKYIFSKSIERLFLYDENENMLLYKDNANECNVENIDAKYVRVVALAANYQDVAMFKGNADNGVGVNMELTYMQNITLKHDNDIAELKQAIVALGGAI